MSGYSFQEANAIDMHEVTALVCFLSFIKDSIGGIWYHDRLHMLDIVTGCFGSQMWHTGYIDVFSHPNIFLQNWEVL